MNAGGRGAAVARALASNLFGQRPAQGVTPGAEVLTGVAADFRVVEAMR